MTHRIVFTPRARTDAMRAFRWIAERSPASAARWYSGLERAVAGLAENPERYAIEEEVTEHAGTTIRQMLHGRRRGVYRILFSIEGDAVFLH